MSRPSIRAIVGALLLLAPAPLCAQSWVPPVQMADPGEHGTRIDADGVLGNFLPAAGEGKHPAILLLGGSEGGLGGGALRMAEALQAAGFSVLQQSYYRAPGQPEAFSRIPLETFDKGLAWLAAQPGVDARRMAVLGGSKGAEAALAVAARHPELRAAVAGMPSAYLWPAFSWDGSPAPGGSWSIAGKDAPFLPYGAFDPATGMRSVYANGLTDAAQHPDAAIAIEKSPAKVLLVCGEEDALWPSCPMADLLKARDPRVTVLAYQDAGHAVFGPPLADDDKALPMLAGLGGSATGNNAARKDGWPKVLAFLKAALAD